MFNLRNFVKSGLLSAIGSLEDFSIILNAAGWHSKGVLTEEDLVEIESLIKAQYPEQDEIGE